MQTRRSLVNKEKKKFSLLEETKLRKLKHIGGEEAGLKT